MATYIQVFNKIKAALTGRTVGTLVQATLLEEADISILNYIEQLKESMAAASTRGAHASAVAGVSVDLIWSLPFNDTGYDYSVNGFDVSGYPVEITLVAKAYNKLTVRTLVNATLSATATPYIS